jgi:hypothetical protein
LFVHFYLFECQSAVKATSKGFHVQKECTMRFKVALEQVVDLLHASKPIISGGALFHFHLREKSWNKSIINPDDQM